MRIAAIAAGGEKSLRERPIASCIATAFTPLAFKPMDVEVIRQSVRYGLPIHACSLPSAAGTAPITMPGVYQRVDRDSYEANNRRDVMDSALETYHEIMDRPLPGPEMDPDCIREIEQIVRAADADILADN
jgi:hypothetical protein